MKIKTIYISGMHCTSCEKILEDELEQVAGVGKVKADRRKNVVQISYVENEPNFSEIKKIAEKFGYQTSEKAVIDRNGPGGKDWRGWLYALLIMAAIFVLFKTFQERGFLDKFNISNPSLNFGVSFLIGLVASVSSCLAIVGAVVIAFAAKYKTDKKTFWAGAIKPNILFHAGRLATFFILGGILGLVGGEINISGNFISYYTVIIAIVMAWLGLNILGIVPPISQLGISLPKNLTGNWKKLENSNHLAAPVVLGASSFFLPCGFTQSMQILALASGHFWTGAWGLFFFASGTVPSLMALGITASWTKNKKIDVLKKVSGMLILVFAVYTLGSGLALRGIKENVLASSQKTITTEANRKTVEDNTGQQVIEMHITSRGFVPEALKIKRGIPVQWVIYGDNVSGCTSKIVIPSLNIEKSIGPGKNIINFIPQSADEIPFSCWMGMVRGKFIVE